MAASFSSSLLDASAISRGEALGIMARKVVEGYIVGEHRSPFRGFAIEFAQHREYTPGDDTRHIDWKVLGRSDRYYIKQYEQDTNFVAQLIVDASESMDYGSGAISKFQFAQNLAACLSYLILMQRDAVALEICSGAARSHFPRTDNLGKFRDLSALLANATASGPTTIGPALQDLAARSRSKGLVFVFSDFFSDEEAVQRGMQHLSFTGQEIVLFHIMDPAEMDFPFRGAHEFIGLEGEETIATSPEDIRKSYLDEVKNFRRRILEICERTDAHYVFVNTAEPLAEVLGAYLAFRHRTTAR